MNAWSSTIAIVVFELLASCGRNSAGHLEVAPTGIDGEDEGTAVDVAPEEGRIAGGPGEESCGNGTGVVLNNDNLSLVVATCRLVVRDSDLSGHVEHFMDARGVRFVNVVAQAVDWEGAWLEGSVMDLVDLSDGALAHSTFMGAWLSHVDLRRADLRGADFRGALLSHVDLTDAKIVDADFSAATWIGGKCPSGSPPAEPWGCPTEDVR